MRRHIRVLTILVAALALCLAVVPMRETRATTVIYSVAITITPPAIDASPDYSPGLNGDDRLRLLYHSDDYSKNGVTWVDMTAHETFEVDENPAFQAGHAYRVDIYLPHAEGYTFTGSTTCTVNGIAETCVLINSPGGTVDGTLHITVSYPALGSAEPVDPVDPVDPAGTISQVVLTITAPVVGAMPDYFPVMPSGAMYSCADKTTGVYKNGVFWYDETDNTAMWPGESTFQAGHRYRVYIYLVTAAGYAFADSCSGTMNGHSVDEFYNNSDSGSCMYIFDAVAAQTGWVKADGKWYYYKDDGTLATGWLKLNNKWYYLDANGVMQTGWLKLNNKWYYLNASGVMQTGWLKLNNKWYYLNASGVMQTGWLKLNNKWYYLNSSGVMLTSWQTIVSVKRSIALKSTTKDEKLNREYQTVPYSF